MRCAGDEAGVGCKSGEGGTASAGSGEGDPRNGRAGQTGHLSKVPSS